MILAYYFLCTDDFKILHKSLHLSSRLAKCHIADGLVFSCSGWSRRHWPHGTVQWIKNIVRELGLLIYAEDFGGQMLPDCVRYTIGK
jgi:hypothetical protein